MNVVAGLGTRIVKGKQADKSLILDKVGALRAQADDRHQNDMAALKQVQESESQMRAQLAQQREEKANLIKQLEAQRLNEAQLRRALSLGAERLAKAQQVELQLRAELEELRWIRELMIGGEAQAVASLLHDVHSRHRCQNAVAESLLREQVQKLLASPQQFRGRRCADLVLGASAETWRVLADWEDDIPTQYERFVNGQARMGAGQMSRLGTEAARIEQLIAAKRDTAWRLLCVAAVGVLAFVQWRALLRARGDEFLDSSE